MNLYTKTGDGGTTSMLNGIRVKKSDDKIELIGTIDELNSHLGLAKVVSSPGLKDRISEIQRDLMTIMSVISDQGKKRFQLQKDRVEDLEKEIDKTESLFPRKKCFVLYGGCELSARLDVARAVARRAERRFVKMEYLLGTASTEAKYMNRLADYLYILARYNDYLEEENKDKNEIADDNEIDKIKQMVSEALKSYNNSL